jgi:hypothetical protein
MPDIKRLKTLIDRLRKLSDEDQVPWSETSDERAFQAALKGYTVTVAQDYAGQDWGQAVYVYAIRIHDTLGKLLETATERDFQDQRSFVGNKTAAEALQDLYDLARRKALKVDQALDDLLRSL